MEYYDAIASGYDELHEEEQLKKFGLIEKHLRISEDDTLLDVGCGTGLSSRIFKCRLIGIDFSREMLKEAKKNSSGKADYVQGKAEHLPFKDKAIDAVLCVTAMHNFESPKIALEEIKRVSKGRGAVTVMRKAKKAEELRGLVNETIGIERAIEEEKDSILFFGAKPHQPAI